MTTAVGGNLTQAAVLAPSSGQPGARLTEAAALVVYAPPSTYTARVPQAAALVTLSAGADMALRDTSLAALVVYSTSVPNQQRSRAWTFTLDGHTFYVLDLGPQGTFVYDQVTNQWANFSTQGFDPQWNFINGTMWGDRIVGADSLSDAIFEMDPSAVLDEGWRDLAHLSTGGLSTRSRTFIGCDAVRVSASVGQIDEVNGATMQLRFSDDQGQTWSDYFTVDLILDDFGGEIAYRSLGSFMAPGRIFELSDVGGTLRIDGADAFLAGFDSEADPERQG